MKNTTNNQNENRFKRFVSDDKKYQNPYKRNYNKKKYKPNRFYNSRLNDDNNDNIKNIRKKVPNIFDKKKNEKLFNTEFPSLGNSNSTIKNENIENVNMTKSKTVWGKMNIENLQKKWEDEKEKIIEKKKEFQKKIENFKKTENIGQIIKEKRYWPLNPLVSEIFNCLLKLLRDSLYSSRFL